MEAFVSSQVFFTDFSTSLRCNIFKKLSELFSALNPTQHITKGDLVAVKLHFGEAGNLAFVSPPFVQVIVDELLAMGSKPFLTDTNTLYVGSRAESVTHLHTALNHGFGREVTKAPLIIADGLRGNNHIKIPSKGKHFKEIAAASDIVNADAMVVISHFKGHEVAAFGGAIKNVGMGCSAREGKLSQHSNISPKVNEEKCIACGRCIPWCQAKAISLKGTSPKKKAFIDAERCVGCAECILTCQDQAIQIRWNESVPVFMEKMVEHAEAIISQKKENILYVTFLNNVAPHCDCMPYSDRSIVSDIGILASTDPLAIDQAAIDLVNEAPGNPSSVLGEKAHKCKDKLSAIYPEIPWEHQLKYAESIGMGSRSYTLKKILCQVADS